MISNFIKQGAASVLDSGEKSVFQQSIIDHPLAEWWRRFLMTQYPEGTVGGAYNRPLHMTRHAHTVYTALILNHGSTLCSKAQLYIIFVN